MAGSDRPAVFMHLLPSLIPQGVLRGAVAVVVDVLRASTVMVQALASGCDAVIPCGEVEEARSLAISRPRGSTILAGERQGLPIEGFDLGNSPGDFTPAVCLGKTLVMTTTNGTRAILASLDAERVLVAAFSNLMATTAFLRHSMTTKDVHIVCAGTDGRISLEDSIFAGALASDLRVSHRYGEASWSFGNDEAEIVCGLWGSVPLDAPMDPTEFAATLGQGRGGRRVREIGLAADIVEAARIDRFPLVAELRRDPLRIVRGG
jgi:2-phosphosulfolactate phosphatase